MSIMENSRTEQDSSKLHDEPKTNGTQWNRIQANGFQVNQTSRPNGGGSPGDSQDPGLQDEDELSRLKALATDVREQVDLERDVGRQVCYMINLMYMTSLNDLVGGAVAHRASQ